MSNNEAGCLSHRAACPIWRRCMRRPFVSSSWSQPGDGVRCLSTTKVRLSSQPHAGNLCPPSNRTPSCTHSTCHATHQCHGCIVCRYPPPSLKLHLHCLTPNNGNKADRRSGQPLEHKISRSHATAEYTPNGARVQSELPCLAARSRPAPRPLSREPKQSLPNRTRGPRYIERRPPRL